MKHKHKLQHLAAQALIQWWRLAWRKGWRVRKLDVGATMVDRKNWDGFDDVLLQRMDAAEEGGPRH